MVSRENLQVVVVQSVFCLRIVWRDTERRQETSRDIPCPDQVSHHAFPVYKFKAFRLAYTTVFCESHSRSCKAELLDKFPRFIIQSSQVFGIHCYKNDVCFHDFETCL